MKKIAITPVVVALVAIFSIVGCKKYPEGPSFSLATKKARVANTWVVEKATQLSSNADVTSLFSKDSYELKKDGSYAFTTYDLFGHANVQVGKWEFTSSKESIVCTPTDLSSYSASTWLILKLKSKEMWVKDAVMNVELHLKDK